MHPHLHTKNNRGMSFERLHFPYTVFTALATIRVLFNPSNSNAGCEEVMTLLEECHDQGYLFTLIGGCNEAKTKVNKCLRAARLEITAENRERAKERRQKTLEIWKQIDEENS